MQDGDEKGYKGMGYMGIYKSRAGLGLAQGAGDKEIEGNKARDTSHAAGAAAAGTRGCAGQQVQQAGQRAREAGVVVHGGLVALEVGARVGVGVAVGRPAHQRAVQHLFFWVVKWAKVQRPMLAPAPAIAQPPLTLGLGPGLLNASS